MLGFFFSVFSQIVGTLEMKMGQTRGLGVWAGRGLHEGEGGRGRVAGAYDDPSVSMLLSYREELAMRLDLTEARVQVSAKKGRKRAGVGLGVALQIKRRGSKSER